ncbi:glycoside hydrolase family 3 protein [Catenulispora subtropica]|uniref:Glycoside hydrolase family 3 N-terminal domain-containing protein n=1 Tax=Catenulispora subtropica TaxID=450798 RepID=A0ABN2RXZ3_9ACTN
MSELDGLIARVLQPGFTGTAAPDWIRRRLAGGLGSVILFGMNIQTPGQLRALTDTLRAENPDVFVAVDEEAGDITRLEHAAGSSYPGNLALGTIDDVALTEATARSVGTRVRAGGIDLDYAPVADVNTEPRNPVIGARSFGADPMLVARHVAAAVRGLHGAGVAACAKHFPGHGDTTVDSHFGLPTVHATRADLERDTLPPFRAAVAAGARAVMVAHLLIPALDPEHPASVSPAVIHGLLRAGLGFEDLAVSDAIGMAAVRARYGLAGAAVRALAAGLDLVCVDSDSTDDDMTELTAAITAAVRDGSLPEARLVEAAGRVAEFAAWRRKTREAGHQDADSLEGGSPEGLRAARRAIRILRSDPTALPLPQPPHVVEAELPRSLADHLAELLPGTTRAPLTEVADAADLPAGRPLVIAVRGLQQKPEDVERVTALAKERPDAIVVELGVPHVDPGGAAWVASFGASRVGMQAVAEVLAGVRLSDPAS